jgi:hypothetical protein
MQFQGLVEILDTNLRTIGAGVEWIPGADRPKNSFQIRFLFLEKKSPEKMGWRQKCLNKSEMKRCGFE